MKQLLAPLFVLAAFTAEMQASGGISPNAPFTPVPCTSAPFADVPSTHPFCRWIKQLNEDGITAGCGNGNYCPDAPVTRAQMSAFLETAMRGTASWDPRSDIYTNIIPVSPSRFGDSFSTRLENGALLRAALAKAAGIAWWTRKIVVLVEPGIYDVGNSPLIVPSHVMLAGHGRQLTEINRDSDPSSSTPVVELQSGSFLKELSVVGKGSARTATLSALGEADVTGVSVLSYGPLIGLEGGGDGGLNLIDVHVTAWGGASTVTGIDVVTATLRNVAAVVGGSTSPVATGIYARQLLDASDLRIDIDEDSADEVTFFRVGGYRSVVNGFILGGMYGAFADSLLVRGIEFNGSFGRFMNGVITLHGITGTVDVAAVVGATGALELTDTKIEVSSTTAAQGVMIEGGSARLNDLQLASSAPSGAGVSVHLGASAILSNSTVTHTLTAVNTAGTVRIASSQLVGSVDATAEASTTCVFSYDGAFAPLSATCN